MRPFAKTVTLIALAFAPGMAQQTAELKHFSINTEGWSVSISAENMAREGLVLHLKGNVEIRLSHEKYLLLHADEADFHIDTGAVEPRGGVTVRPIESPKR